MGIRDEDFKKRKKGELLKEHFEDPEHSDVLIEKQVKEEKKKR
jgi:hypothetical protein